MSISVNSRIFDNYTFTTYNDFMNIKELRNKTGLSQSNFARKYGIPVRTLQQWEQNRSSPSKYVLNMLENIPAAYIRHYKPKPLSEFKLCIPDPFQNCNKIYPIQQRKVSSLLSDITKDENVKKVIIFGSSVTDSCHSGSDVDIFVDTSSLSAPEISAKDFEFDLWTPASVDGRLLEEILKKGVVVYERNAVR